MKFLEKFKEIKGDASFRKFYRNTKNNSIIVYAKKEKNKNLLIYDAINKILIKNNILAPRLLNQNYKKNYIEIQDFGNETIYQILKKKKFDNFLIMKKIINILNKIQLIKDKQIKNFQKKNYKIKKYDNQILLNETKLFSVWYVANKLSKNNHKKFNYKFNNEIKLLISKLNYPNETFVHRDFHVSNLMHITQNDFALIDNQDALIGNRAYDLASLVDDVRLRTSSQFKQKIFNYYLSKNRNIKSNELKNDFDILSVLRNLKIIVIFLVYLKETIKENILN